jgi:anti-sigma B factor antagonist
MKIIKSTIKDTEVIKIDIANEIDEKTKELNGNIELDIENQLYFIELIDAILEQESSNLIINMSHITYIDSSGLWALFEIHKKAQLNNGKIILLNPTKDVKRVLDITKMSSKLIIEEKEQSAINHFVSN